MKKIILIFLSLSFGFITSAQSSDVEENSVVLCETYYADGTTSGLYSSWDIYPSGGYVYIVYNQEEVIKAQLQLQVDKLNESSGLYMPFATVDMVMQEGKNWAMYDYGFTQAGMYLFKVMNGTKELARTNTEIFVKEAEATDETKEIDTYYYENSIIAFGTSVTEEGVVVDENTEFTLENNNSIQLVIYVSNDNKKFATDTFYIDVYDEGDNMIDSYYLDIDPEWDWLKFTQTFTKKGKYEIDIYNADDIYITTGSVTIK